MAAAADTEDGAERELTSVAVEPIEGRVVTVTSVGRVALDALATVSTRQGGIEALSGTVPPDALCLVYFPL